MLKGSGKQSLGVVLLVGLCQGGLGLADVAVTHIFREEFHMRPSKLSTVVSFCSLPWLLKPLWAFLIDSLPLHNHRRRPYLSFFSLLSALSWAYLAQCAHTESSLTYSLFLIQLSVSICSVIGEALVVEESHKSISSNNEIAANFVTVFFGVRVLCVMLTNAFGEILFEVFSKREIVLLTAAFPVILSASAPYLEEVEGNGEICVAGQIRKLAGIVGNGDKLRPALFIFLYMSMPTTAGAMLLFYTKHLNFGFTELVRLKVTHGFASLMGIFIYNRWFRTYYFREVFAISSILGASVGVSQLLLVLRFHSNFGLSDSIYSVLSGVMVQTVGELASVPLLILCCRVCPEHLEATVYTILTSLMTLGSAVSQILSQWLMQGLSISEEHMGHLWLLVILVYSVMLLPLPLLQLLPREWADNGRGTV